MDLNLLRFRCSMVTGCRSFWQAITSFSNSATVSLRVFYVLPHAASNIAYIERHAQATDKEVVKEG
jgi:hypothetical protein